MKLAPHYADAFDDLEPPIRDLERMAAIALDKVMQIDDASAESDMAVFAVTKLFEMAQGLRQEYDRLAGGPRGDRSTAVPLRLRVS